ncbi:MAG: translation initiation factor IF-2 [Saprospiraceae bacterium]
MTNRLVKVAKELNVGTATIVDYLTSHGFDIEDKPSAKVTDEMYNQLVREFQKDRSIKEQADQLIIGTRNTTSAKKDPAPPVHKPVVQPVKEDINVATVEAKKEEPAPVERPRLLQSRLKILGKIELDKKNNPVKPTEEVPVAPEPPIMQPEPPAPVQEEVKQEQEIKSNQTPVQEKEPVVMEPVEMKTSAEPKPEVSPKEESSPNPESDFYRAEAPELRGLKILGKIDTDKFKKPSSGTSGGGNRDNRGGGGNRDNRGGGGNRDNRGGREGDRNRPQGSDNRGREGDRNRQPGSDNRDNRGQGTPAGAGGPDNRNQQGQRPNPNPDNRGPRPQNQNNGAAGESDADKKRRKRKRKKVTTENGGNNTQQGQQGQQGGNRGGNNAPPRRDNRPGDQRPPSREDKEVSQREIEEQIKATMARLSGGGKKKRQKLRRDNRERLRERQELLEQESASGKLEVTEFVSVSELASLMNVAVTEVITACLNLGVIVSINQRLDAEIIELIAEEFGHEVEFISAEEQVEEDDEIIDDPEDLESRAPIVTVMGHVDHGKTSLLDYIREANVVAGEAGGITQHIGAYEVEKNGKKITFLDTPGHEAFTAMRARGAKITDIAIIVIAADDSIMPQTREAISHAQAANVPMIFAINKIDKPGAQPEKIKQELAAMNILVEDWGGKYQSQDISAKTGLNIDLLLEKVLLEAEILDLKANPNRMATGTVIEASLDKGRGYVTKILVQNGTLNIGDSIVSGEYSGKVKAMFNERGKRVTSAGPATPVLVLGLGGAPQAGERVKEVETEQEARQIASKRAQIAREQMNRATKRISLDEIGRRLALGNFKELNLIVKGDVDGSVEALSDSLIKLSIEKVQVNVIHRAVGAITESDVLLASASDAIIIGFQVRPSPNARKLAEKEGVQIKLYSIIYEAIEEIKMAIEGMLEPTKEEKIVAQVEVREVYKISKVGTIAGCYVQEGKITRNTGIRIIRDGIVVFPSREGAAGKISSLKRFKDDMKEVKAGLECGISIENYNDIKVGDIIEGFEIIEIKQKYRDAD